MRLTALTRLFSRPSRPSARRVLRVSRVVTALDPAERFYRDGLGFQRVSAGPLDPAVAAALGQEDTADTVTLRLGGDEITLVQWRRQGAAYPTDSRSNDCWFQHLAIVVNDMAAAHARLMRLSPRTITTDGPQRLPPANAHRLDTSIGQGEGVSVASPAGTRIIAFKFRDPDGHPLELIQFPPDQGRALWHEGPPGAGTGPCLGIDHTAIAVSSTPHSLRFYRGLGFKLIDRSFNHGPAQAALDGLPGAQVRVSSLRPGLEDGPGLELLGYLPPGRATPAQAADAALYEWTTIDTGAGDGPRMLKDPDGHVLVLV